MICRECGYDMGADGMIGDICPDCVARAEEPPTIDVKPDTANLLRWIVKGVAPFDPETAQAILSEGWPDLTEADREDILAGNYRIEGDQLIVGE